MDDNVKVAIEKVVWATREESIPRRVGVKLKHPKRIVTGNLKFNATRILHENQVSKIYIDENIAPYMPYTNEPWNSPRWKGVNNPNENWFEEYAKIVAEKLAIELGGELIIR